MGAISCCKCGKILKPEESLKRESKKTRFYYVCKHCGNIEEDAYEIEEISYLSDQSISDDDYTVSIEFQTSGKCAYQKWDTLREEYDWQIVYDQEGYVEYKTPHYLGLNRLPKALSSIEEILGIEHWKQETDYSTYVHISNKNFTKKHMEILKSYYTSLFMPLWSYLQQESKLCEEIFGKSIDLGKKVDERVLNDWWIEIGERSAITFKFGKYIDGTQFMKVINLYKRMASAIVANFIAHYEEDEYDTRRYDALAAYRAHKAEVTAGKLVSLVKKSAEKRQDCL